MQSEYGYGFLLRAPADYPEADYQEIKNSIEKLCLFALNACKKANQEKLNFAIWSKEDIFVTVSVRANHAEFALFDKRANCIIQEYNIFEFEKYVNQAILNALAFRIENECKAVVNGSVLKRENLDLAWQEKYANELSEQAKESLDAEQHDKNRENIPEGRLYPVYKRGR